MAAYTTSTASSSSTSNLWRVKQQCMQLNKSPSHAGHHDSTTSRTVLHQQHSCCRTKNSRSTTILRDGFPAADLNQNPRTRDRDTFDQEVKPKTLFSMLSICENDEQQRNGHNFPIDLYTRVQIYLYFKVGEFARRFMINLRVYASVCITMTSLHQSTAWRFLSRVYTCRQHVAR